MASKIKAVERLHANAGRPPLNVASESFGVSIYSTSNENILRKGEELSCWPPVTV